MLAECTVFSLRYTNLLATLAISLVSALCRDSLDARTAERDSKPMSPTPSHFSFHSGLNIALFPVIFFFSALYYTDIFSTLIVLVAYHNHLYRLGPESPRFLNDLWTVLLGVAALFMRQTNVFWVVVYMGGLEAAHAIRSLKPPPVEPPKGPLSLVEHVRFYAWRDSVGDMHDPPLNTAWPEGTALPDPSRVIC